MPQYVAGRLLVGGFPRSDDAPWLVELREALAGLGVTFRLTRSATRRIRRLRSVRGSAGELLDELWVSAVVLEPVVPGAPTPQAWWVLERLRHRDPVLADRLSLQAVRRPGSMGSDALGSSEGASQGSTPEALVPARRELG